MRSPHELSHPELNLLLLLDTTGRKSYSHIDGTVRWSLAAEDVCYLLHLAVELIEQWGAKTPMDAYTRAARLLAVPVEPADTARARTVSA